MDEVVYVVYALHLTIPTTNRLLAIVLKEDFSRFHKSIQHRGVYSLGTAELFI